MAASDEAPAAVDFIGCFCDVVSNFQGAISYEV
jgi:hypothetical protein